MTFLKPLAIASVLFALTGCVTNQSMYNWGGYSDAMYRFYQEPEQEQRFADSLLTIITDNEAAATRVPPGVYAEYGYMMLSMGKSADAVEYFIKEQEAWPESKPFMDTVIELAKNDSKAQPSEQTGTSLGGAPIDGQKAGGQI